MNTDQFRQRMSKTDDLLSIDFEFDENTQEGRDFAREFALWILEEYDQQDNAVNWANNLLSILNNLPELR